ncbi:hypothetical protein BGZ63DRAFT_131184 [Mariannaea sp. PMI_226]|nr:hypothetical protein BGZ63DRAFT_131184 [Mariannaea sp. PMI_226]
MDSSPSPLLPPDPHGHDATTRPFIADADAGPGAGRNDRDLSKMCDDFQSIGITQSPEEYQRLQGKTETSPTPPDNLRDPLTLLRLPIDILRLILHEVSHPNKSDLLPLLLVNSTLHDITVPYIYSSFDIIWPEEDTYFRSTNDVDVDALTSGLTSLALGSRFARTMHRLQGLPPPKKQESNARFIKSFRISNGLPKWVNYYTVSSEAGMMLNTLVAMALPKMVKLESFIWDMPTGVSSNVFMSLSCLEEDNPGILDGVWIRWHQDSPTTPSSSSSPIFHNVHVPPPPPHLAPQANPPSPPSSNPESLGSPAPLLNPYRRVPYRESSVEYPTYSILPALQSIAALDVNELSYLDELAILVERSKSVIREFRLSIATRSVGDDFAQIKGDQRRLRQYDPDACWPGESRIGDRRLGGVLGIVLARVYDIRENHPRSAKRDPEPRSSSAVAGSSHASPMLPLTEPPAGASTNQFGSRGKPSTDETSPIAEKAESKLTLECLELAQVPLYTAIAANAFDWTVLTTLTILDCDRSDRLWRLLRETFRSTPSPTRPLRRESSGRHLKEVPVYHLKLKNIHVDITTFAFLQFVKDTLAPHTLEILFLHDRRRTPRPTVPIAKVYEQTVKRHLGSLKKLLLDSSHPDTLSHSGDMRRMCWALPSDLLLEVTSGCMTALKELSVCVSPRDWHTILQRLPNMPKLTALHIPSLGRENSPAESTQLALQIVDVITLRPEIRLCFLAIRDFCFQIVESTHGSPDSDHGIWNSSVSSLSETSSTHPSDDGLMSHDGNIPAEDSDGESQSSRRFLSNSSAWFAGQESSKTYRLRNIAFYDECVAIFKARHGTL